jgi:hypothetical protein
MATGQQGAGRPVGSVQGVVQGGMGVANSSGFTTIHPVIESMETGEVEQMDLYPIEHYTWNGLCSK